MGTVLQHAVVSEKVNNQHGCCKSGPGYASPLEAMSGPRETLIYVTAVYTGTKYYVLRVKES
jgi:methanethiol oxidase